MSKRSETFAAQAEALRSELLELDAEAAPTDEQVARSTAALAEYDVAVAKRDEAVAHEAKMEAVRAAVETPALRENGFGSPDLIVKRSKRDAFDATEAVRAGSLPADDMRLRASDAVEAWAARGDLSHDQAEKVAGLVEYDRKGGDFARHALLAGSDTYKRAFQNLMQNQGEINALNPEEQASVRAALSLTGANGGFLIPVTLDPTIILTNAGSANPYRKISQIKTITTNFWEGVTSSGVNAGWLAEGAVAPDATPTVTQPVITPAKAAAWVFGSYEVLGDTDFAQQFPSLLVDAKDRLEEAAFTTGTGTAQPKGIVTAATTAVTTAAVATYAIADIYSLQAAIPPRFRLNDSHVAIVANVAIINKTRQFDVAGGSSYWTNLGLGSPETVLGIPLYESTTMVGTTTTASKIAVAGDFNQYAIVDRVGMTVMYEPMVKDTATARPTGQAGWFAYWRVGADALVPGAFRTLTVQ